MAIFCHAFYSLAFVVVISSLSHSLSATTTIHLSDNNDTDSNLYLYGFTFNVAQFTEKVVQLTVPLDPTKDISLSYTNLSISWNCLGIGCAFFQSNAFFEKSTSIIYLANEITEPKNDDNVYLISSISFDNNIVKNLSVNIFPVAITMDSNNNLYLLTQEDPSSGNSSVYCSSLNKGSFYELGSTQSFLGKSLAYDYKELLYMVSISNQTEYRISQMSIDGGIISEGPFLGNYSVHGLSYSPYLSSLVAVLCYPSHFIPDTPINFQLALIDPISSEYTIIADFGNFSDISGSTGPSGTTFDINSNTYYTIILDTDIYGNQNSYLYAVLVDTFEVIVKGKLLPQEYSQVFFSPFVINR